MSLVNEILTEQEITLIALGRVFGRLASEYANRALPEPNSIRPVDGDDAKLLDQLILCGDQLQLAARRLVDPTVTRVYQSSPPVTPVTEPALPEDQDEGALGEDVQ